ncbi:MULTISPECIES: DUF5723 family protein [unclassified Mucilaginibacter]|uniref:DUF5723 family protein n=1 Tax=unclassified Mucilaginibacter TaxID=2617802 RepID=UPI0031F6A4E3
MNKFLIGLLLIGISTKSYAQRFAHYNTGTLYDSFENPSQAAFIPDSSRQFAFSLLPNISVNAFLQGNGQYTLKSRLFLGRYNSEAITVGQNQNNNVMANVNGYIGMLKMFTSLSGKQEVGVSWQVKGYGRGMVTDETMALFNGAGPFIGNNPSPVISYANIFNSKAFYEAYHQFSITYREKVTQTFAVGVKLSALSGIAYNKINITQSNIDFFRQQDAAVLALAGTFQSTYELGTFRKRDLLPNINNPGAAIGLGATYTGLAGIIMQGNIKDLGFIRWGGDATTYTFGNGVPPARIEGLSTPQREKNVSNALTKLVERLPEQKPFVKPIVGRAEFSMAKKFMFGKTTYLPTAIVSKQLYGSGTALALVNQIDFGGFGASLSGISNEEKRFDLGLQFMYKSPNFEIFVGSEQLGKTMNLNSASGKNEDAILKPMSHSGGNIYFGFSFKFGKLIERWKGEGYHYNGAEQGPLGQAWNRWFNK